MRINPQTVNNVVTYDVVVQVDNTDGALLPGMTANATIDVASANDALVVPLAAAAVASGEATRHRRRSGAHSRRGAPPRNGATASAATSGSTGTVFVQRNGTLVRVPVTVNLGDQHAGSRDAGQHRQRSPQATKS